MLSQKAQRKVNVIFKAFFGIILASVTLYLVWYEFEEEIFRDPNFLLLLMIWALYGFVFFLDGLAQASKKTTGDKVDDLIIKVDSLMTKLDEYIAKNELGKEQETKGVKNGGE